MSQVLRQEITRLEALRDKERFKRWITLVLLLPLLAAMAWEASRFQTLLNAEKKAHSACIDTLERAGKRNSELRQRLEAFNQ